ncbi:MAG: hypothetical protein WBB74_09115 [Gaiellaceae bacterium]
MTIGEITIEYGSEAELLDMQDEIRHLYDLVDDGVTDLGPTLRSLLRSAYHRAEALLADAA